MAEIGLNFENKKLPIHDIPGPEGGCNLDNIKEKLGWAIKKLRDGLRNTYLWIKKQIEEWTSPFMVDRRLQKSHTLISSARSELLLALKDTKVPV